jgi:hypothetical protein
VHLGMFGEHARHGGQGKTAHEADDQHAWVGRFETASKQNDSRREQGIKRRANRF